ncbi:head maturation protease, ClpP-related [uncultured Fusobacterium sp.]|uniref:head maturation protease, ClpP-related n=1 Tax=uncultured Fusobacterium sp. TaxID=159267 RepID=UPI0025DEDC39|nr:head maturation protease, ClpP-related [uncultured Fusobacterium sp.]
MIAASKNNNILTLRIYGYIGRGWFASSSEEVNSEIERYGKVDEIHVRIHSPGGSIAEGCAIYNSLKNNSAKVKVFIEGECCSIATVIAMAGDEIVMSPVANFMIHNPLVSYISGGAEELREKAEVLDKLKETIINAYTTKSHLSREEISDLMDKETYFTAKEALNKGFITGILDLGEQNSIGTLGKYNYQHVPENYFNHKIERNNNINLKNNNKIKEGNNMDLKNLTLEQLKAENPQLVNSIKAEERERIKAFDLWANKTTGAEEIIKKYKYDDPQNATDVMEELLNYVGKTPENSNISKEEKKNLVEIFENKKKDYENSGVAEVEEVNTEELKAAKLEKDISSIVNLANTL